MTSRISLTTFLRDVGLGLETWLRKKEPVNLLFLSSTWWLEMICDSSSSSCETAFWPSRGAAMRGLPIHSCRQSTPTHRTNLTKTIHLYWEWEHTHWFPPLRSQSLTEIYGVRIFHKIKPELGRVAQGINPSTTVRGRSIFDFEARLLLRVAYGTFRALKQRDPV